MVEICNVKKTKVIAVIPALNEENTLAIVLQSITNHVNDIIVVDDGSVDDTAKIAAKYAYIVKHQKNCGYDHSINDGFKAAKERGAEIIITLDADGQHLAADIPLLVNPIIAGEADVVIGRRPYQARFMESVFARYGKKYGINDPLCGMKAYSIKVYNDIGFFDTITSIGTQLAFMAYKKGYRIKEVSINLRKRKDTPRFGRKLKANYKLFKAYLRLTKYINEQPQK